MKRPGVIHGVVAALVLALVASMTYTVLGLVFSADAVLRLLVTALAGAYVAYMLTRTGERSGRLTMFGIWSGSACVGLVFGADLTTLLLGHVVGIWLVRALCFHRSVFTALVDLGLSAMAFAAAIWAAAQSNSIFMAVWCFFLVQALFVTIPDSFARLPRGAPDGGDRFQRSYAAAERAVRRIAAQR